MTRSKVLKFIGEVFLSSFLVFLIALSVSLTIIIFINNHQAILKQFGVYIKDDCKFHSDKIECSFIEITDKKSYNIKIDNLLANINWNSLYNGETKLLNLKIKHINGNYRILKTQKKSKAIPISPYFLTYYTDIDVDNIDFKISKEQKNFLIKNLSVYTKKNILKIKKPFEISALNIKQLKKIQFPENINLKIKQLETVIYPENFYIKKLNLNTLGINLNLLGSLYYDLTFNIFGSADTKKFKLLNNNFHEIAVKFRLESPKFKVINGKIRYTSKKVQSEDFQLTGIKGKFYFRFENNLYGKNEIEIKKAESFNIYADFIKSNSTFDYNFSKKWLKTKNEISTGLIKFLDYQLKNVYTDFSLKKEEKIKLNGSLKTEIISGKFSYINTKESKFKFISEPLKIEKIIAFAKDGFFEEKDIKNKILESIKGNVILSLDYFIKEKIIDISSKLKKVEAFGLPFEKGQLEGSIDIKNKTADYTLNLTEKDSKILWKGFLQKDYLESSFNAKKVSLDSLMFTKVAKFGGIYSGKGRVFGKLKDLKVEGEGTAHVLTYQNIKITDIPFFLKYENFKMQITGGKKEENLSAFVEVDFKPFNLFIDIYGNNTKLSYVQPYLKNILPVVFEKITLKRATGEVKINVKKGYWGINLDIEKGTVFLEPVQQNVFGNAKGIISKDKKKLKVNFYKKEFTVLNQTFSDFNGEYLMEDEYGYLNFDLNGYKYFDSFNIKFDLFIYFDKKRISGIVTNFASIEDLNLKSEIYSYIEGNFKKVGGVVIPKIKYGKKQAVKTDIFYTADILENGVDVFIHSEKSEIHLKKEITKILPINSVLILDNLNINAKYRKDTPLYIMNTIDKVSLVNEDFTLTKKGNLPLIYFKNFKSELKNNTFSVERFKYSGALVGFLETFNFNLKTKNLNLFSKGKVNKEILPQLVQLFTLTGDISYQFYFNDNINKFKKALVVYVISNDLKLWTPFTKGIINFEKFSILYKNKLKVNIFGKSQSPLFGESSVEMKGTATLEPLNYDLTFKTNMLTVKYENLFVGNINSNLNLKNINSDFLLKGKIDLSGRSNLDPSLFKERKEKETPKFFEKFKLDITASTYSPLYIYGDWGKAYTEGELHITGDLAKPIINGEFNIVYGKIYVLKNEYNVDYMNIRIINNSPYINARLSTSIAQTFIFINVTGPIDDLRFDYSSTPPMTKEQILATLLLKETPATISELSFFSAIGKFIRAITPFTGEEEGGLFNTGFEISIFPRYSPVEGIVPAIYARKSLTRKIYLALSRALGPIQEFTGWYEAGYKITEKASIALKKYETDITEVEIVFSLPFDF